MMELQATPLEGIVRSSDGTLFYLFPIQDVSTLQTVRGHLACAIDVLNSLVAALSVHDGDHYSAIDSALEGGVPNL